MTRVKKVKYSDGRIVKIEISIKVETAPLHYTRDEADSIVHELCDQSMRMLNATRYLHAPLSDIRVQ